MTSRTRWVLAVSAAAALDYGARVATAFDFAGVMHAEAILFPLTTIVLALLLRSEPRAHGWRHGIRVGLVWAFGLGALRPVLWSLGAPLMAANLVSIGGLVAALLVWAVRRRRTPAT